MRSRYIAIVGLIATAVFWTGLQLGAEQAPKPDNSAELVQAAKDTLTATMAASLAGRATIEDVYQWSRRLMAAEQLAGKASASADHLQRMDNLHQQAEALYQAKAKGSSVNKAHASRFYFLEAQAMNAAK
jgi:hypothetical protein